MTEAELKQQIAERTELPLAVVSHIVDIEHQIVQECLSRGEEVKTPSVLLHSAVRNTEVVDPKSKERTRHSHVMIYVRPRSSFRKKLKGA